MNEVQKLAELENFQNIYVEAFDEVRLANVLAHALRPVLLRLSKMRAAQDLGARALSGLRNFAAAFNVSFQ